MQAERYFVRHYLQNASLMENIFFVVNEKDEVVGSCIAWFDKRKNEKISSLHWLVVDERYQGLGIGKVLCNTVMEQYKKNNAFPVYIHSQPWSYKAIFLYLSLGFKIQKNDSFSNYENQYELSMNTLQKIVTKLQFEYLLKCTKD